MAQALLIHQSKGRPGTKTSTSAVRKVVDMPGLAVPSQPCCLHLP
ncbi:MAG: hypothetical protein ACREJ5_21935 [Geminicoccaceae bacterium]